MTVEKKGPIRPDEVINARLNSMPDEVFEAFNQQISQSFDGRRAVVKQKDVIKVLKQKGFQEEQVFKNGWLDVEGMYRKAGWSVKYDKPGYNEDYDAYFEFSKALPRPRFDLE